MKKLSIVLVTIVLCCSAFLFTGCDQAKTAENNSVIPHEYDLANVEVGTKLPTLHPANFSYQYQKDDKTYMFHIDDFSVELYEKRTINEGDVITEKFYPYTIKLAVKGYTTPEASGQSFYITFSNGRAGYAIDIVVGKNGEFFGERKVNLTYYTMLHFSDIG